MRATLAAFFAVVDGVAIVVRGGSFHLPYIVGLAVVVIGCGAAASALAQLVPATYLRWGLVAVVTASATVALVGVVTT